jgi:hypothetical protein
MDGMHDPCKQIYKVIIIVNIMENVKQVHTIYDISAINFTNEL